MAKDGTDKLIAQLKKSMGAPANSRPTTRGKFLGFDNKRLEQVFRAVAHAHPKAVLVKDDEWREPADLHVQMGYMKCAVHSHGPTYKLTESGVRRAKSERLIEGPY